jgi:hypothetical protein
MRLPILIFYAACAAGCVTQQAYEGPKRSRDEVAHISGDLRFNAGVPVTALLRRVDEQALGVAQSSVDVEPGRHRLLVDCKVQESGNTTRHSLDIEVHAGLRYRLVPEMGPGLRECAAVHLESVN